MNFEILILVFSAKNEVLYSKYGRKDSPASDSADPSSGIQYPGIFPSTLLLTLRLVSELRQRRPDFHHSVRISALYYSQRRNVLIDLFASFDLSGQSISVEGIHQLVLRPSDSINLLENTDC